MNPIKAGGNTLLWCKSAGSNKEELWEVTLDRWSVSLGCIGETIHV